MLTVAQSAPVPNRIERPFRLSGGTIPWLLLAALVLASAPVVVKTPVTSDTTVFDLQARRILDGGVLYRDVLEPNFPGIVWLHVLIRSVGGWSAEVIRIADLFFVGLSLWLLSGLACVTTSVAMESRETRSGDHSATFPSHGFQAARGWLVLLMAIFYLSRNEWCHCQRDSWMLLPVSLAMTLRLRGSCSPRASLVEGVCWGIAFWIKPHVAIPAIAVMSADCLLAVHRLRELSRCGIVICGGLMVAIPGIWWLIESGAWAHFVDMQLNWNPEYLRAASERRSVARIGFLLIRLFPWWLVHIAGIIAVGHVVVAHSVHRARRSSDSATTRTSVCLFTLAGAWLLQASLMQHAMDYIQVPPVCLMLAALGSIWRNIPVGTRRAAFAAIAALGLIASPQLTFERLRLWNECVRGRIDWQDRDTLAQGRFPNWTSTGDVVAFLRSRNVADGDVTCFTVHSLHIYRELGHQPTTPYPAVAIWLELFPSRRTMIRDVVQRCGHRFVVTDNAEAPPQPGEFPWNLPVVFESGSLRVHDASRFVTRDCSGDSPNGRSTPERHVHDHSHGGLASGSVVSRFRP